jgi:hypothetical protein
MASKSITSLESRLCIYNEPLKLLTSKSEFAPECTDIITPKLQSLVDDALVIIKDLFEKGTGFTNARSLVLQFFDGPDGLFEIAARAKQNVKRNYRKDSPEYKALVNKAY